MTMIELTIGDLLDDMTQKYPDNDALVYVDRNLRYSYREFTERCNRLARGLMALNIQKGDKVAVWANNVPEWVFLQFATAKIGAVLVTVNTYYKSHELKYLLQQSDSTTLLLVDGIKADEYIQTLYDVLPELKNAQPGELNSTELPLLKNIIHMEDTRIEGAFVIDDIFALASQVSEDDLRARQQSLDIYDVINMQYTSGTTGFPKGVQLSHFSIVNNAYYVGENLGLTEQDRYLIPVPFFHCFGCVLSTLNCVSHGATMVPVETFNPEKVLQVIEKEKCTAINGVPTMFIAELNVENFDHYDLSSLRTGIMAGATCPVEIMKAVQTKMHCKGMTICYGLTEFSPVITQTLIDDSLERRTETVGTMIPGVEAMVIDPDTGKECALGEAGELIARGHGMMVGYYKNLEATEDSTRGGWLHTKDLATMDEDGYFKIIGRIDDMIIRGGENIYPREIEEFLFTHPDINDAAVVGVPSEHYGEEVAVFIECKEGKRMTAEQVTEFCTNKISRFKIPKYIFFVDSYPLTASGKIQKFVLRDMAKKEIEQAA
jgi:fatty-acyl-CoA synthase